VVGEEWMFKNFEEWVEVVPVVVKQDSLWEFKTYQKALFLSDLAWIDSEKLLSDERG
jgi:hypothetical protein